MDSNAQAVAETPTAETNDAKIRDLTEKIGKLKVNFLSHKVNKELTAKAVEPLNEDLAASIQTLTDTFKAKHAEEYSQAADYAEKLTKTEADLRAALVEYYELTKEKTFDENLSVKVTTTYDVDKEKAIEWAEKNMPVAIGKVVNTAAIDAIIALHKTHALDFVHETDKPSAVIKGLGK